jgi:hypothetical protein
MARIEISLEEYNELKETIKKLENDVGKQLTANQELKSLLSNFYEELDNIVNNTAFFDRVFKWKETIHNAEEILKKYEEK